MLSFSSLFFSIIEKTGFSIEKPVLLRRRSLHGSHYTSSYVFLGDGDVGNVSLGDFIAAQASEGIPTQTKMSMTS